MTTGPDTEKNLLYNLKVLEHELNGINIVSRERKSIAQRKNRSGGTLQILKINNPEQWEER